MRKFAYITAAILSVTGICLGLVADDAAPVKKENTSAQAKTVAKPAAKTEKDDIKAGKPEVQSPANQEDDVPAKYTADEAAIRKANESLLKAYASDSPQAVAEHFTQDGEYVNSSGAVFHGRDAIQESLATFFADNPGCELQAELHDLRFVSPTVAIVEGTTTVVHEHDASETNCNFTAVYNKTDNKWLIASVRDQMHVVKPSHETQLEQLSFLIGDWVNEDSDSVVSFSCRPTENGKYLIRDFTMKVHGQDVLSGTERIGWDPVSGRLRAWIFDSEGGFADGTWTREGDTWILRLNGVSSDGELASGSSIYHVIDNHSVSWQAVDHVIGGVAIPDGPEFTLVHKSPLPLDRDEKSDAATTDEKPAKSSP
jgi:uncharacterized protein (TIGR02246 family)